MEVIHFVEQQADKIINEINEKGYISGGENGPYADHETPVRVSAHWIIIMSWLYKNIRDVRYYTSIEKLGDFLLKQHVEDFNYNFYCRRKIGKDHVNGTIGAAWVIEGLVECGKVLNKTKYFDLAENVFLAHPYNKAIGLWNRTETDGRILGYDETFNHQLWLAAAGAQIIEVKKNNEIKDQIIAFLDHCLGENIFRIHENGTICHYSCVRDSWKHILRFKKLCFKQNFNEKAHKPNMRYKEEGYHYFALYAFALLYKEFSWHDLFSSYKFRKAIEYAVNENNYLKQLNISPMMDGTGLAQRVKAECINIYAFPYNSPAFELPLIFKTFRPELYKREIIDKLWELQIKYFMDENGNFEDNVQDSIVLTARIYELLRAI